MMQCYDPDRTYDPRPPKKPNSPFFDGVILVAAIALVLTGLYMTADVIYQTFTS